MLNKSIRSGVKAPFGYYGAKQRLASAIVKDLPPHNAWVEGFCGSAALTLAKEPAPIEVINDLDGQITNLFLQLRDHTEELCRLIALTPYSRLEFEDARHTDMSVSGLEAARRFLVATMMTVNSTYGGSGSGFSYSDSYVRGGKEARVNRWYNLPDRLQGVVERLRSIRIENLDARILLGRYTKRPGTLIYLDPPYFVKRGQEYVIDANDESFHKELLDICNDCKCMLLISGYATPLYSRELTKGRGWKEEIIKTHTRDTTGKIYAREEVLWMNRAFTQARDQGRPALRLSPTEKLSNKLNPQRE